MTDNPLDPAQFGSAFKAFMEAVVNAPTQMTSPLLERIRAHLVVDPTQLPVIAEEFDSFEHPNLQLALDEYLSRQGRRGDLLGVAAENKRFMSSGLSDILSAGSRVSNPSLNEGPVDYINFRLSGGRVLSCVQFGLYLLQDGDKRLVVLVLGPTEHGPWQKLRVEVAAAVPADGQAILAELIETMARLNVYRGHIISLSPGRFGPGPQTLIAFHTLPRVERQDVILPEGILERVERQTIVFAEQAERLKAVGRSLKRGLLLYGPPGVGKTLTVQYLSGRMEGRTVLLTAGYGLGLLRPVVQLARTLAPSMVVLEDVDLIAEDRDMPGGHAGPLLFELLNEMDGLQEDCDVIFILTTNRPESLEPALAARPGRIDLAVELPLPDAVGLRLLLARYSRGLQLRNVDLNQIAERIGGASPAYVKELLRKAAVLAATEGGDLVVTGAHLEMALEELNEGGRLAQRLLGFQPAGEPENQAIAANAPRGVPPTGFPSGPHGTYRVEPRR